MEIRPARPEELSSVCKLYEQAQSYMSAHGNPSQWGTAYPPVTLVEEDIRRGFCHVCVEKGEILGVFSWIPGPDPTYAAIEGSWHGAGAYTVVHRLAVGVYRRGVASACLSFAKERSSMVRIDTHEDNLPMQETIRRSGFSLCGVIHVEDGSPRLAYDWCGR